jgi:hypothetical protein
MDGFGGSCHLNTGRPAVAPSILLFSSDGLTVANAAATPSAQIPD